MARFFTCAWLLCIAAGIAQAQFPPFGSDTTAGSPTGGSVGGQQTTAGGIVGETGQTTAGGLFGQTGQTTPPSGLPTGDTGLPTGLPTGGLPTGDTGLPTGQTTAGLPGFGETTTGGAFPGVQTSGAALPGQETTPQSPFLPQTPQTGAAPVHVQSVALFCATTLAAALRVALY